MKSILLSLIIMICYNFVIAQSNQGVSPQAYENISFTSKKLTVDNFFQKHKTAMGLSSQDEMKWYRSYTDQNSISHHRYHQYHNGIRVYGETYILHEKNEKIYKGTGVFSANISLKTNHRINKSQAIEKAKKYFYATSDTPKEYNNSSPKISSQIKNTTILSTEEVIIDYRFPEHTGIKKAAYLITLQDPENLLKKEEIIISKSTGGVIFRQPLILHHNVPSTGLTRFYGLQSFTSDSISPTSFILKDDVRNIQTLNGIEGENIPIANNSSYWELPGDTEVAIDAHYATTIFYDMMFDSFNWQGIDGNGGAMNPVINARNGKVFLNAYWNGSNAYFGNGDCHHAPLTTLSIVGHEFMHGITDYTSNLLYASESGALNEAYSDIFGKAAEYYNDNENFTWLIGAESLSDFSRVFRSMSNPNDKEHPKYYKGEYWMDNAGVHTNSSVLNHWFYLMIEGGQHTNEIDETYNIIPVEMNNVLQILFNCQTSYLTELSNYMDIHEASIIVTEELYGETSTEYESLIKAWAMVGLPNEETSFSVDLGITLLVDSVIICSSEEFIDVDILISNVGESTIFEGDTLDFFIGLGSGGDMDEIVVLTQDLLPGEDYIHTFVDIITSDPEYPTVHMTIIMSFPNDNNTGNNRISEWKSTFSYSEPELNFNAFTLREGCFDNEMSIYVYVYNISCAPIPLGQTIDFVVHTTPEPTYFTRTTTAPLAPGDSFHFIETIPVSDDDSVIIYNFEFTSDIDGNVENNQTPIFNPSKKAFQKEYTYTFDDEDFRSDFLRASDREYKTFFHNSENYLAATARYYSIDYAPCSDIDINFKGTNPYLKACLDLSDFDYPYLEFDMLQFRNNEVADLYPELSKYTSILKITAYDDFNSIEEYYYDQNEGESVHQILALPPNFMGIIEVEAYNQTGDSHDMASSIAEYDVILLDNFYIGNDQTIGAKTETEKKKDIFLYPNPTSDLLQVSTDMEVSSINLYNSHGVGVKFIQPNEISALSKTYNLNTLGLPAGIYFIKFELKDGRVMTKRFVKI